VLIKKVEIKRANKALDLSEAEIAKLKTGAASLLVEGTITMTWIRFIPKETKTNGAASPAPAAPAP
jgi:ribosomal protein S13